LPNSDGRTNGNAFVEGEIADFGFKTHESHEKYKAGGTHKRSSRVDKQKGF